MKNFIDHKPKLTSVLLWILAGIITIACFMYQDKTGPTYPLEGEYETNSGVVDFKFLRSETIGTDLKIMFPDPVPNDVQGYVEYRRYKSYDEWSTIPMEAGEFEFSRRGSTEVVQGIGAELPSLEERAGKYEFFVYIEDGDESPVSITGEKAIYARYKGAVPNWALLLHITIIFVSMTFAVRTVFEAIIDGNFKWMINATIISLLVGGFILGPLVQLYAFGVWWSGIPFGYDWTDNKVLLELLFWLIAAYTNWGERRNRKSVYLAGFVMLLVYFIPHSVFGSEYDYRTGTGRGTSG
ncbi:MAG: hypothetical protein U9O54_03845 [Chloroflexota bacterium]|nr:hypothetical protein [Chloroflexota bacterium]